MIAAQALADMAPGFADLALDAQRTFRRLMDSMAKPGRVTDLDVLVSPPVPGFEAAGAIALALLDFETPVWFPDDADGRRLANWVRFHCGCPVTTDPAAAAFALATPQNVPPVHPFNAGDAKYPERSTTLLIVCPALMGGTAIDLTGPGIAEPLSIAPTGLSAAFWGAVAEDRARFQLGVDLVLTCGTQIIGLPRSTRILPSSAKGE